MNRLITLGLTTALGFGLSLPALAQTPPATATAPAESGLKTTAPETKPASVPAKHHHNHVKRTTKAAPTDGK